MGLESFDIAPDNKGGRKKKSSEVTDESGGDRDVYGSPYHPGIENPYSWWKETAEEALEQEPDVENYDDGFSDDASERDVQMKVVASYAHINSIDLRRKLESCGLFETDWDAYKERINTVPMSLSRDEQPDDTPMFGEEPDEPEDSGGLQSIVNNAK